MPRTVGGPFSTALEILTVAAGLEIERAAIERAKDGCDIGRYDTASWAEDMVRLGSVIGLRVRRFILSPTQITDGAADALMPFVLFREREGDMSCVCVRARALGRLRVTFGDDPTVHSIDKNELARLLQSPVDAPLEWVTADPSASVGNAHHGGHPTPLRRLIDLVKLEHDDVGVIVIYASAVGLLSLATPLGVQFIVNTVAFGALLQPLVVLTLLVLAGLGLEGLLRALKYWVIERVQQRLFVRVALDVAYRLPRVRESAFDDEHPPELVNRFFDVVTLQKGAATVLSDGVSIVLYALMGMLILGFYHPFMLGFDVVLLIGIVFVVFVLGRNGSTTAIRESEAKYAIAGWLEDAAKHRTTLAHGDGPSYVAARADALTREWLDRRRKHWRVVFRQTASALALQALASAALLGLGGWLVLSRQLSLGQLVAAELIVTGVVSGVAKLGKSIESFYDLVASADKLGHLLDLELVRPDGAALPSNASGLDLHLDQADVAQGAHVFARRADLHLRAGSHTVIYGPGGAGKSTLVDVLTGTREPAGGRLVVEHVPAAEIAVASLGAAISVVRDPEVFEGTLLENVAMGRPAIGRKEARDVLHAVGLGDLLASLPDGLQTHLTTDARILGRTAATLLTIARALAKEPRLLVLDGALDVLDTTARRTVWRAVSARSCTVLVTTARRELVELADTAFILESQRLERVSHGALGTSWPSIPHALPVEES